MIIRSEEIKDMCSTILAAVDSSDITVVAETLQLKSEGTVLTIAVTNREYYASVSMDVGEELELNATVNAMLFLKLISQITTDTIDLEVKGNNLVVVGNGTYKLPMIFDGDALLELPKIKIDNVTTEFKISSDKLNSVAVYNSKELQKGTITKAIQKLYYMDECGAITFTTGACVNTFSLEKPIKILMSSKVVKLFKLFKDCDVDFTLGCDMVGDFTQTKAKFSNDKISITAILPMDDSTVNSVPVSALRNRAFCEYPYTVMLDRDELLQTLNRLLLFKSANSFIKPYCTVTFTEDSVKVVDMSETNSEVLHYVNTTLPNGTVYTALLDVTDLKLTLDSCSEKYLSVSFGDSRAFMISRGNIKNVMPEMKRR